MWYVIQVINGREGIMRERIERVVPAGAVQELFNMRKPLSIGVFVEPGLKPGFFVSRREGPRTLHV